MDNFKIGNFIASERKHLQLTQEDLAKKLNITSKAVSKWETGKGMPDASIMLDLCKELGITVNELLTGERLKESEYKNKSEENLLLVTKKEQEFNKKIVICEDVIGCMSSITFMVIMTLMYFAKMDLAASITLIILASLVFITGIVICIKIETETGMYECKLCKHRYIPRYRDVFFAMHIGRTRFLKCPKCHKYSWNIKVIDKKK